MSNQKRRFIDLLPARLRTEDLTKFFSSTVDHVFQPGRAENLAGYIGQYPSYYDSTKDLYVGESTAERSFYQLEATMVSGPEYNDVMFFNDFVGHLRMNGANVLNQNRMLSGEYYTWAPPIDIDKITNPQQYNWFGGDPKNIPALVLTAEFIDYSYDASGVYAIPPFNPDFPEGSELVSVVVDGIRVEEFTSDGVNVTLDPTINLPGSTVAVYRYGDLSKVISGQAHFDPRPILNVNSTMFANRITTMVYLPDDLTSGMRVILDDAMHRLGGWDSTGWDMDAWDSDSEFGFLVDGVGKSITLLDLEEKWKEIAQPIYVLMERGALNQNPWSMYNYWVHRQSYAWSGKSFGELAARRPIIEFLNDMELYNYGRSRVPFSVIGSTTSATGWDVVSWDMEEWDNAIPGVTTDQAGEVLVPEQTLVPGQIILVNKDAADEHLSHRFAIVAETEIDGETVFVLVPHPYEPQEGDLVRIEYTGAEYFFNGSRWIATQPFVPGVPPLFRLYDLELNGLDDAGRYPGSTFTGNRVFGYSAGDITDSELNLPVRYDNLGQFVFENEIKTKPYTFDGGRNIEGMRFFKRYGDPDLYENDWRLVPEESMQIIDEFYTVPMNLQANPNNEDITTITRNEWFEHFDGLMSNQQGFDGETYGTNNYRDTPRDLTKGRRIVQHRASLLKAMLMASSETFDLMEAIRYSENEYARFRARFLQQVMVSAQNTNPDLSMPTAMWVNRSFVISILNTLKVNKTSDFPFATNRIGGDQYFIPPTPAAMGVLPNTVPGLFVDDSYGTSIEFLRGHDGSVTPLSGELASFEADGENQSFVLSEVPAGRVIVLVEGVQTNNFVVRGNIIEITQPLERGTMVTVSVDDPRDVALLILEQMIYDSIHPKFKSGKLRFNLTPRLLSKHRDDNGYTHEELTTILLPMFSRWAQINGLDYQSNSTFDPANPFTWNYRGATDSQGEQIVEIGHWRGLYRYYYDTDRPHIAPWEMLGLADKPDWWESEYGPAPYTSTNTALWADIEAGIIRHGPQAGTHSAFTRPNMVIPVDAGGDLLPPTKTILLEDDGGSPLITVPNASSRWAFGDGATVESLWRQSPNFGFALARAAYLMRPAEFVESCWDTVNISVINGQTIYEPMKQRPKNRDLVIHGDYQDDGSKAIVDGVQQWVVEHMVSKGQTSQVFSNAVRNLDVRLGHKMGGFTSKQNMRLLADNFNLVPEEDIAVRLYQSPSLREEFYSGALIERVENGWRVVGYDILNPNFTIIPGDEAGRQAPIGVSESSGPIIHAWRSSVFYRVDQLVQIDNSVYQCVREHLSSTKFEDQFWDARPDIRIPRNEHVVRYLDGLEGEEIVIPYGSVLTSKQEVADFMLGYERYLKARGWVFDRQTENNEAVDWTNALKEFLVWSETNWSEGSFIALSPLSQGAKFATQHGNVLPVEEAFHGSYGIVDKSGMPVDRRDTFVTRLDGEVEISVANNDLYGIRLAVNEIEHIVLLNNETIFGDLIYNPLLDLRQPRLKMFAEVSTDWNGRMDAPGYVIDGDEIIPSFDKASEDIRYMFDIEMADNKVLREHARHNIGFETRDYMDSLMLSDTQQFEFYQGMIRQKGAPGVFNKLLRSQFISESRNLKFLEEWAFKKGEFGGTTALSRVAFDLFQSDIRRNPQFIVFGDGVSVPTQVNVSDSRFVVRPDNINMVFPERDTYGSGAHDLPNAGFVRRDEVDHVAFDMSGATNLFWDLQREGRSFMSGDKLWIYENGEGTFEVFSLDEKSTIRAIDAMDDVVRIYCDHGLTSNTEYVLINGDTDTVENMGGIHRVVNIDPEYIDVKATIIRGVLYDGDLVGLEHLNESTEEAPAIFQLRSLCFDDVCETCGLVENDLVYVRGSTDTPWRVMRVIEGALAEVRRQPKRIDTNKVTSALIYDRETEISDKHISAEPLKIDHLLVYDPVAGMISGDAEKELSYKTDYDPARYNSGSVWGSEQIGSLWWDLTRVRFIDAHTDVIGISDERSANEIAYRVANWGKMAPGSVVEVYEWTRSLVPPSEWSDGVIYGGDTPKYIERMEFDDGLSRLVPVYYFWVRDRESSSLYPGRTMPTNQVVGLLTNPTQNDLPWIAPVTTNGLLVSGVQNYLNDATTVLQMDVRRHNYDGRRHTEWELLRRDDERSVPGKELWDKLVDSLAGSDAQGRPVPDPLLHQSLKQGVLNRPRQSMFAGSGDDNEIMLLARESFVNMINAIFERQNITQDRPDLIDSLYVKDEPQTYLRWSSEEGVYRPVPKEGVEVDFAVTSQEELDALLPTLDDGRVVLLSRMDAAHPFWSAWTVVNGEYSPTLCYNVERASVEEALADPDVGPTDRVLIRSNNGWTIYRRNGAQMQAIRSSLYDLSKYWERADWYAIGYGPNNAPVISYPTASERNQSENPNPRSTFVRINDDGTGSWAWTAFVDGQWVTVARQNGTIVLSEKLYDGNEANGSNNIHMLSGVVRRHLTDAEINELFFSMVHFAHAHIDQINWAFKTSFLYIAGYNEEITQTPVQVKDGTEALISYIDEVKPYRVKTRDFARTLNPPVDNINVRATDFDKPPYYDADRQVYRDLRLTSSADMEIITTLEPWKTWYNNYTKSYRPWKRLVDPTRTRPVDNDVSYDPETVNPIRRFRSTIKFSRVAGEIMLNGEIYSGGDLAKNIEPDFRVQGGESDHTVGGSAVHNPGAYNRPEEMVLISPREYLAITTRRFVDGEEVSVSYSSADRPLSDTISNVRIGGWDGTPWDLTNPEPPVSDPDQSPPWDENVLGWDSDVVVADLIGWNTMTVDQQNFAVLLEPLRNDDDFAVIEANAGFSIPVPSSDAPGVIWIGNERIEYSEMDRDSDIITISGLVRMTRATMVPAPRTTVLEGEAAFSVGFGPSENIRLTIVHTDGRQAILTEDQYAVSDTLSGVDIVLNNPISSVQKLLVEQVISTGHPIGTKVFNPNQST